MLPSLFLSRVILSGKIQKSKNKFAVLETDATVKKRYNVLSQLEIFFKIHFGIDIFYKPSFGEICQAV